MTDLRRAPAATWLAAAAIGAAAAGVAVAQGHTAPLALLATLLMAVAIIIAIVSPHLGLLCVFATIPLDTYGKVLSRPVPATAFQVLLAVVLVSWLARVLLGRIRLRFGAAEAAATVVLVAALWSLPFSLNGSATLIGIQRVALDTALFVVCVQLIDTPARMRKAALALAATILAVSVYAFAQYVFPGTLPGVTVVQGTLDRTTISRVAALFLDPNTLGGLTAMAAAAFLALAAHARRRLHIAAWLCAAAVAIAAMVVTFSRGSWLALVLALPIVVLTAPRDRRRGVSSALAAVALAAILLAPGVIVARVGSAIDIQHDHSAATRFYMFISAAEMVRDRPVFGTGLNAFDVAYPAYRKPQALPDVTKPPEVPLALVAETGIGGMAVLLVLGSMLVRALRRHRGRPWAPGESASAAGLTVLLVGSLFQYYLYFPYVWILAAFWVVAARLDATGEGDGT